MTLSAVPLCLCQREYLIAVGNIISISMCSNSADSRLPLQRWNESVDFIFFDCVWLLLVKQSIQL